MARRRRPAKRLLIVPTLLIIALLVGLHLLRDTNTHQPDSTLQITGLPTVAGDETRCTRSDDLAVLDGIRAALQPDGRVTSGMVLACPAAFDGMQVRYIGELVGDLLERDGGVWVMVNDDDYALEVGPLAAHNDRRGTNTGLTVWLPDTLTSAITGLGTPDQRGDVVDLHGQIVRTDATDGGGLTLRAERLTILAAATRVDDPLDLPQAYLAIGSVMVGATLWPLRRRAVHR